MLLTAGLVAVAAPATAASFDLVLPAGTACDFELQVSGSEDERVVRTFTDADGNLARIITAGRGTDLTFTNLGNGESLYLAGNGSVLRQTFNPDGSRTEVSTGHSVLILFPSDVPAGPSTTLYTGQVTYTIDVDGVFTVISSAGQTRDICAELA